MVEILKPAPDDWHFDWTCKGCQAELRAKKDDVNVGTFGGGYDDSGETRYYATCPTCGEIGFLSKTPPPLIQQAAEVRRRTK